MSIELQTTYRSFAPPMSAVRRIRAKLQFLERVYPEVTSCALVAELMRDHRLMRSIYRVSIAATTGEGKIIANYDRPGDYGHENLFAALADAFDALDRALQSHHADKVSVSSKHISYR